MMRRRGRENAMLKPNQFKRRLATGRNLAGIWLHSASPATIEALGDTGYDCLIVDNEHGPSTLEQTRAQLQASFPYDCGVCVRVPWNDAVYLQQLLDLGADTVMIPMVDDAEQAKAAVAACRYPPKGIRSYGPIRSSVVSAARVSRASGTSKARTGWGSGCTGVWPSASG